MYAIHTTEKREIQNLDVTVVTKQSPPRFTSTIYKLTLQLDIHQEQHQECVLISGSFVSFLQTNMNKAN